MLWSGDHRGAVHYSAGPTYIFLTCHHTGCIISLFPSESAFTFLPIAHWSHLRCSGLVNTDGLYSAGLTNLGSKRSHGRSTDDGEDHLLVGALITSCFAILTAYSNADFTTVSFFHKSRTERHTRCQLLESDCICPNCDTVSLYKQLVNISVIIKVGHTTS